MPESRSIDLHDRTVAEAIKEFVRFYNDCLRGGYRGRIEVIHGYGSTGAGGAIRLALRKYLTANQERVESFLAGESLGNPGVTILYPKKALAASANSPASSTLLSPAQEAIRRFCATPKSREKILIKLRGRFGDQALAAEIRAMVSSGALEAVESGDGSVQYRA